MAAPRDWREAHLRLWEWRIREHDPIIDPDWPRSLALPQRSAPTRNVPLRPTQRAASSSHCCPYWGSHPNQPCYWKGPRW